MFCAGTECSCVANTGERSSHAVYAADFTCTKPLPLRREASVRMQPAHNVFLIPITHLILHFQAHARSAKTWRLEASTQAFFRFFLLKNAYFCTFLLLFAHFY